MSHLFLGTSTYVAGTITYFLVIVSTVLRTSFPDEKQLMLPIDKDLTKGGFLWPEVRLDVNFIPGSSS